MVDGSREAESRPSLSGRRDFLLPLANAHRAHLRLEGLDVSDETWGAKATVMKENIEHHIEEEEGEMFRTARQVFDRAELVDLGERMAARKTSAKTDLNIPCADASASAERHCVLAVVQSIRA